MFPDDAILITKVFDINNSVNGGDFRIDFTTTDNQVIEVASEVRVMISKNSLTLEQAIALSSDRFGSLSPPATATNKKYTVRPSTSLTNDAEGTRLQNDIQYKIYLMLKATSGDSYYLSPPKEITLKNKPVYAGNYSGLWNDALFPNFAVTMRLNDDYTGVIFYSNNFTTCCPAGGASDASATFVINGNTITSFTALQYLGDYKGGHCPATYKATGTITDEITLSVSNLTGTDCDGNHAPGTIVFTRQ